jgi:hypothetical protein
MKLLETVKLYGVVLVAAAHTDLGDSLERQSGYFDKEWNWEAMKPNATFIHQFHSIDDHCIPVHEARFVADRLAGNNHTYEELSGEGHFFRPFGQLLDCVDRYCSEEAVRAAAEIEEGRPKGDDKAPVLGSIVEVWSRGGWHECTVVSSDSASGTAHVTRCLDKKEARGVPFRKIRQLQQ